MAISVSVGVEHDGPVVRHRADAAHRDRLRATGERLRRASHDGVVVVRRSGPLEDGWELVTAHAGPALTPARVATAARLAAIAGRVAAILADLHERGVVHGRLRADRVLLGADGAVVLCGFGPGADGAGPADDVAGLGATIEALADGLEAEGRAGRDELGALRAVARVARSDPATRRPSARRLAAELEDLRAPRGRVGARPRHPGALLAAAGAVVVLVVVTLGRPGAGSRPPAPVGGGTRAPTSTSTAPPREPPCVARAGQPVAATACGHDVAVDAGSVVVDGRRSAVGAAGDAIAVADWGCEGGPRPAVLRPGTDEVLVFSAPGERGARHVVAAARVPGARRLTAIADPRGCPQLVVELADGTTTPLDPEGVGR